MDEVKIWAIEENSKVKELEPKGQMDTEWSLEDTLVKNPDLLMPELTLVGRQTPTEGGPLDLLGVDSDGRLVVFELKRGTLSREAIAQVIDYASDLEAMELGALAKHISERSGQHGVRKFENFEEWYNQEFGDQGLDALRPLRLFLVGLGADDRTERMVTFLAGNSGMDISLLTFHGFTHQGKTLLAKQVHVEGAADSEPRPSRRRRSQAEHKESLERRVARSSVSEFFYEAQAMFRDNWRNFLEGHNQWGLTLSLRGRTQSGRRSRRQYARVGVSRESLHIVYFPVAKALCLNEFRKPVAEIRCQTWPRNLDPVEDDIAEIQFALTAEEWETHKQTLTSLTKTIYDAWQSTDRGEDAPSSQDSVTV